MTSPRRCTQQVATTLVGVDRVDRESIGVLGQRTAWQVPTRHVVPGVCSVMCVCVCVLVLLMDTNNNNNKKNNQRQQQQTKPQLLHIC